MRLLVTGAAGFVGSTLIDSLLAARAGLEIIGFDNLHRPGSEINRTRLADLGVRLVHGDLRLASDLAALPSADWAIDAAALPSVLGGVGGPGSSRQLLEHNLGGTLNIAEYCKAHGAGLVLISTSRVYSIDVLSSLPVIVEGDGFALDPARPLPSGVTAAGVSEACSTAPPVSLYGTSKVAAEQVALEYGHTFDLPVRVNRCGVLAGAGQFATPGQGIFSYWVHAHREQAPLTYIGFGGQGHQVRDCLHPRDLVPLILTQIDAGMDRGRPDLVNVSSGTTGSMSLRELTQWCATRFGPVPIDSDPVERVFDLPWVVLDATLAREAWGWAPEIGVDSILSEIADHAEAHPDWLARSAD